MEEKTNIVIKVDKALWTEFRKRALDEGTTAVRLLEKAMTCHLDRPSDDTDRGDPSPRLRTHRRRVDPTEATPGSEAANSLLP